MKRTLLSEQFFGIRFVEAMRTSARPDLQRGRDPFMLLGKTMAFLVSDFSWLAS